MRALLIALAAVTVVTPANAAPANAEGGLISSSGRSGFHRDFDRHDRRRHHGVGGDIFLGDWEYTGNQAFRSDSYNDWWHDRPERAYPRWMQNNANCERKWWGGDTLRC